MGLQLSNYNTPVGEIIPEVIEEIKITLAASPFIEANTIRSSLTEIKQEHIIPVFVKDNEPVISHSEFVETVLDAVGVAYPKEAIFSPNIRLSHPVKGRVPEAKNKPASELLEHEKTLYYERMAFTIEIPSISTEVGGNKLNLNIGGVKAYNLDNLNTKSGVDQHFKVFIGFQNKVCTNMCISTEGCKSDLRVKSTEQLYKGIIELMENYNAVGHALQLEELCNYELTERQFATLIGRCRMYKHMPDALKSCIPELQFGDSQINMVCRDYYADNSFCSSPDGSINLWKLYNLFTGANKSTYIDSFLDRGVNAHQLAFELQNALKNRSNCWFLN